jgi:ribosomal protein L37AE/L43A
VRSIYHEALGAWVCEACGQPQPDEAYNQTPDGVHLCDACADEFQKEVRSDQGFQQGKCV